MKNFIPMLVVLQLICASCSLKNGDIDDLVLLTDTLTVNLKPNRIVQTYQFTGDDSSNTKLVKVEYSFNNFILKEVYSGYKETEFDGMVDGVYLDFYNKHGQSILRYFCNTNWGDSTLYKYYYCKSKRIRLVDVYKNEPISLGGDDDFDNNNSNDKRQWIYAGRSIQTSDVYNQMIEQYDLGENNSKKSLIKYNYFQNRLVEVSSFDDDNNPFYHESFKYFKDSIVMIHKNNDFHWLPFYSEISKVDKFGNVLVLKKFDNKNRLMHTFIYSYKDNKLVSSDFYNEKSGYKVSHRMIYKEIGR